MLPQGHDPSDRSPHRFGSDRIVDPRDEAEAIGISIRGGTSISSSALTQQGKPSEWSEALFLLAQVGLMEIKEYQIISLMIDPIYEMSICFHYEMVWAQVVL